MAKNTVNSRLAMLIKQLNVGQTEFCHIVQISSATYHNIVNDTIELQPRTVKKICAATKASEDFIFHGKGEMFVKAEPISPDGPSWKDIAFEELKKANEYLQKKFDESQTTIAALVQRIPLGKSKALIGTGSPEGESIRAAA